MAKKHPFLINTLCVLFSAVSLGIFAGCSDTIDKSPLSSIPDNEIPTDIAPVSSGGMGLQIKGGSIGRNDVTFYIRFEDVMYKNADILFRLGLNDSVHFFEQSLNKPPNNFINNITYKYPVTGLTAGTNYFASIVMESERVRTTFTTRSE